MIGGGLKHEAMDFQGDMKAGSITNLATLKMHERKLNE